MVIVDASDTTTITYTTTDGSHATPAANAKFIRRPMDDLVDSEDKGTSILMTPAATASTDCPVIEIETWVPYAPGQFFMGDDENTSASTKATKNYRQVANGSSATGSSAAADPPVPAPPVPTVPAVTANAAVASAPAPAPAPAPLHRPVPAVDSMR